MVRITGTALKRICSAITRPLGCLAGQLGDLLFPSICISCDKLIEQHPAISHLCERCHRRLERNPPDLARRILAGLQPSYLDELHVAYRFDSGLQPLIHALKYQKMPGIGLKLGREVLQILPELTDTIKKSVLIPVPLHPGRLKERGYNQSRCITEGILDNSGQLPVCDLLLRHRYTATQTRLDRRERRKNVRNAFYLKDPGVVAGRHFLIIDDVTTTGATLNECARMLRMKGAKKVIGLAVAAADDHLGSD